MISHIMINDSLDFQVVKKIVKMYPIFDLEIDVTLRVAFLFAFSI